MKPTINSARVFAKFRKIFNAETYVRVDDLASFDSGHVSRMRSGKVPISHAFFLACCIAADMSPKEMCDKVGIPPEYFLRE